MSSNEKIQRLIATLSNMGISMDLLEGSVGDAARTVNELGAVSEETWARIGQALSVSLADELKVLTDALKDANAALAEYARTNDQINEAKTVGFTEDQMKVLTDGTMGLTGAQRLAMAEAMKTADAQTKLAKELELTSEAFLQAGTNAEAYRQRLEPLIKAVEEKNAAAIEYIKNTLQSAETEARQAEIMRDLVDLSTKVADGHMTAADASKALEEKYGSLGLSVSALQGMFVALAAQSRETASGLAADAATAAAAWQRQMSEVVRAAQLIGKEGAEAARIRLQQLREDQALVLPGYENAPERGRIAVDIKQAELDLQREINRETKAAEDLAVDWAVATGNVVPELERARKEYARIMSTASSATKEEKQRALELAQIIRTLEGALEGAKPSGGGGGGGGGKGLSDQERLNNQLALDQLRADQQAQDALIAHEERMLEIRKDYAERTLRAIEEFQEDQKSGRASFYESLTGIEDHGLQKAMSAQFEAAALEAGKIAQTLGPDVAAEFLQQMQKNIIDQAKRQQEISKALDKGSDDFNPALAEYLQGVDQLFRVSEQGAINQILRARDSLAMSEQGAIQDAEQKYIDALAKISDTASESAERRIEAVRLAGKEIDMEIAKVQELGAAYEKIGFTPGSQRTVALQGNAPDPMAGVSESLSGIAADITSVLNAIRSNTGDTASAVRRLSPSVTQ
jgi:DNA-binding ferritin-like protein (Dps family)